MRAASPAIVVIIGKEVDSAIGRLLRRDLGNTTQVEVIKQPNAHMSIIELEEYRRKIFTLGSR